MPGFSQPFAMATPSLGRARQPHLRLLETENRGADAAADGLALIPDRPTAGGGDHVLVAGADASARMRMLAELRSLLPPGTRFVEAGETWEVVARAAGSRMVVLAGDLGEVSCASLLRLLAGRYPELPVLAVGGADRRSAGGRLRAPASAPSSAGGEHCEALDAARA
jgi:hypothetical protein